MIYGSKPGAASSICSRSGSVYALAPVSRMLASTTCATRSPRAAGQGLPMIGKLLGHTQVATTARYAHLAADPVKASAEKVSSAIAKSISRHNEEKTTVCG